MGLKNLLVFGGKFRIQHLANEKDNKSKDIRQVPKLYAYRKVSVCTSKNNLKILIIIICLIYNCKG